MILSEMDLNLTLQLLWDFNRTVCQTLKGDIFVNVYDIIIDIL